MYKNISYANADQVRVEKLIFGKHSSGCSELDAIYYTVYWSAVNMHTHEFCEP